MSGPSLPLTRGSLLAMDSKDQLRSSDALSAISLGGPLATSINMTASSNIALKIGSSNILSVGAQGASLLGDINISGSFKVNGSNLVLSSTSNSSLLWLASSNASSPGIQGLAVASPETNTTFVLNGNGHIYGWGDNTNNLLLTNGSTTAPVNLSLNASLSGLSFTKIAASLDRVYALTTAGAVYTWDSSTSPTNFSSGTVLQNVNVTHVAVNSTLGHGLAIGSNGQLYGWNLPSTSAILCLPDETPLSGTTVTNLLAGSSISSLTVVAVAVINSTYLSGIGPIFVLASDGNVYNWGYDSSATFCSATNFSTGTIISGVTITALASGSHHVVALGNNGIVYAWGNNADNQLGDDSTTSSMVPVNVSTNSEIASVNITSIACGQKFTLALGNNGNVYGWGMDDYMQLNNSSQVNYSTPFCLNTSQLEPGPESLNGVFITAISCNAYTSILLDANDNIYCVGDNSSGQGGDPSLNGSMLCAKPVIAASASTPQKTYLPTGTYVGVGTSNPTGVLQVMGSGANSNNVALYVKDTSFVGIGKSNAEYALDVLGDVNFSGNLRSNGVLYAPVASQFTTAASNVVYLASGSNLGLGGKSNAAYALDVAGDINFSGNLRSNGVLYAPVASQFATVAGSNIVYLASGSNLGLGGKSNAAYTLDVIGDINVTGNLRSNGQLLNMYSGAVNGGVFSLSPTYVELLANNNSLAMTASVHTYTSSSFTTPSVTSSALVSYSGSGWVAGGGLFVVTATVNGVSKSTQVHNPGTSHMPVPALSFVVPLAASTSYSVTLTFSDNALTDSNDNHNLNVTMFPNTATTVGASTVSASYNWRTNNQATAGIIAPSTLTHNPNGALAASGQFTAPAVGAYSCSCQALQVFSSGYLWIDLMKVSNSVTTTLDSMLVYNPNPGSFSTLATLAAGDIVYYAIRAGSTTQINGQTGTISFMSVNATSGISQFANAASNVVFLPSSSNLGLGGKSNAAYSLDVIGDINFTGTLRSNNTPLSLSLPSDITVDNVDAKASATLSVGANAATTILNLGTNGANQAINMGTGSGLKTITIGGGTDDTIAINGNLTVAGTTVTVNSSNANILDKVITLNKGGAAASGALVGLEIEEAGSAAGAYLRTNATRDAWVAKAPNGSEVTIGGAYTASAPLSISGTTLSIANATSNAVGVVRVDGTTITAASGVISGAVQQKCIYSTGTANPGTVLVSNTPALTAGVNTAGITISSGNKFVIPTGGAGVYLCAVNGSFIGGNLAQVQLQIQRYNTGGTLISGSPTPLYTAPANNWVGGDVEYIVQVSDTDYVQMNISINNASSTGYYYAYMIRLS